MRSQKQFVYLVFKFLYIFFKRWNGTLGIYQVIRWVILAYGGDRILWKHLHQKKVISINKVETHIYSYKTENKDEDQLFRTLLKTDIASRCVEQNTVALMLLYFEYYYCNCFLSDKIVIQWKCKACLKNRSIVTCTCTIHKKSMMSYSNSTILLTSILNVFF